MKGVDSQLTIPHPVSAVRNNVRTSGDRQNLNHVEELHERDADLSDQLKLAYRALMLVSRGRSEREAVQNVAASDSRLERAKPRALALVLGTMNERDLLDMHVHSVLSEEKLGISARSLFRLTAYAILRSSGKSPLRLVERSLRAIAPIELLPRLELFLGNLLALDTSRLLSGLGDSERVALETHHTIWWVNYCFRIFGRGDAVALLSSMQRPRYIRVNPLKNRGRTTLPKVVGSLAERLTNVPSVPGVYNLNGSPSAFARFFSEGLFQLQDLASYLAIKASNPKPGEKVLDLCAAPGAKTTALAQSMKNRGRIVSVDYSPGRMKAWKREIRRLGVKIAEPVIGDGSRLGLRENFDLVVIDPPCTGTGVFDRNPRMKWHLSPQTVDHYSILQRHFLESAVWQVGEDGRILYCTCSLTIEENEGVVSTFLKSHQEFETRPILEQYGSPGLRGLADCRRFYPHRDRTAGYFIALIERTD